MRLRGAFTALLLLVGGASAVIVLPPTNLTISCQSLSVTASWEYEEQPPPPTSFIVHHTSSSKLNIEFNTSDHHVSLSRIVLGSEMDLLAFHSVQVIAVRGGNRSEPAQFPTFTFNNLKPADVKCTIDFPPVDLSVEDLEGTVTFMNPLYFYKDLKWVVDLEASVSFTASISNHTAFDGICPGTQKNCKADVTFPDGVETCVTLTGLLFANNGVNQVSFRKTEHICDVKPAVDHVILLVVLLSVLLLIIIVAVFVICKVKAWIMKPKPLPRSLLLKPNVKSDLHCRIDGVAVSLINKTGDGSSDRWSEDGGLTKPPHSRKNSDGGALQPAGGCEEVHYPDPGQLDLGSETEDDSADDSLGTDSIVMNSTEEEEEEEEQPSGGYDRPHVQVDMGDGDMVEGYRE